MADGQEFKVTLRFDGKEVATGAPEAVVQIDAIGQTADRVGKTGAAAFTGLSQASQAFSASTSEDAKKILDRYDPVGAKLAQLKADFAALNQSAMSGAVGPKDDARTDLAYAKIAAEIKGLEAAANGVTPTVAKVGTEMAAAAEKGMFATVGARRELIVLGHEAMTGNFSRMPGSFMVLAERIHLSGAALLALSGTLAAVGIPVYVLAKAFAEGHAEMEAMNNALAVTSGYAGLTRGQMIGLAQDVSAAGTMTVTQSKALVTQLVASGKIGADALAPISRLADNFAAAMGKDVATIGPELLKLFEDPAKGAKILNEQMHFLTLAEQEQIDTLVRLGQATEAQLILSEKLSAHLPKHVDQLGDLQRAWLSVRQAASNAWDAMLARGREQTTQEMLAEVTQDIERGNTDGYGGEDGAKASQARLQAQLKAEIAKAKQSTAEAEKNAFLSGEMDKAKPKSTSYKVNAIQDEIQGLDKALTMENAAIQAARDAGDKDALRAHQASAKAIQEAIKTDHKEIDALHKAQGAESRALRLADLEETQKLSAEKYKEYNTDIATLLKEGVMSERDALAAKHAVAELALEDERASLQKRLALARDAAEKRKAQGALDIIDQKIAAQPSAQKKDYATLDNKQGREAGAISTRLADAYGKEDRARQQAEDTALMSESQKRLADALAKVNERAIAAREALDLKFPEKERQGDAYKQAVAAIDQAQQDAAASAAAWNDRQDALNASWQYGADQALKKYVDSVQNVAAQSERLMTQSFSGMEDGLAKFVRTGKLDFKSLENTVIDGLIHMGVQAAMTSAAGAFKGAGGFSGIAATIGKFLFSADGNVFDAPGGLHQYVNTVRDTPTFFDYGSAKPFANGGIFAEAGAEAVMPLAKDASGRLGVHVTGGGGGVPGLVYSPNITIDARNADTGVESRLMGVLAKLMAQQKDQVTTIMRDAYARKGRQVGF